MASEASIAAVERELVDGGYSGILGFSQGAMLAAIVAARASLGEGVPSLQLAVCCGGAVPKPYEPLLERMRADSAPIPTLHCLSHADNVNPVEQGVALAEFFGPTAEILWHDAGHSMPPGDTNKEVTAWLDRIGPLFKSSA